MSQVTEPRRKRTHRERYDIGRSPFAQKPTQTDLATLVGLSKKQLKDLYRFRETCIIRKEVELGGKLRQLAYPVGPLRRAHERLKFHLEKIKQPDYLLSPRIGRSQRDNAALHLDQAQYLTLDIRQFYPSTTVAHVRNWLIDELGMYEDVASLLANLLCVDRAVSFGSPVTPVLCTLVHRQLFESIAGLCEERGLRFSLWVDDITISGRFVPGELVSAIRQLIAEHKLKSHAIRFRTGSRPVFITGIGVVGRHLVAPQALHQRIKRFWDAYHDAETNIEQEVCIVNLLTALGTLRHIAGPSTDVGRRAADEMHSLRQKKRRLMEGPPLPAQDRGEDHEATDDEEVPW